MASLPYPRSPFNNSPTDGTDQHRWLGCVGFSHGIHGIHRSFWRRIFSHGFHRCSQMVRLRRVLWEDSLVGAWVWQGCHTLLICAICGRISCVRNFCGFCGFCGKIFWWLRGYGRMPYPPNLCPSVQSVVEYLASETSVVSVGSVGR